jgi:hypothetical protein
MTMGCWGELVSSGQRRWRIAAMVRAHIDGLPEPSGSGAGQVVAAVTARKARATMARVVNRCHGLQPRTW